MLPAEFDHSRYVPAILTRKGEQLALRDTDASVKQAMTPLFVAHPIDREPGTGIPKRSVDDHITKLLRSLLRDWGTLPAFIDLQFIDTAATMSDGSHPMAWLVREAASAGLTLAPAVSSGTPAADRAAAFAVADSVGNAIVFRLPATEWVDLGTPSGDGRLLALLAESGRTPAAVHLIIDMADQVSSPADISAVAMRATLRSLPHALEWRSVTLLATGMPVGTADVGANNSAELPRLEWQLWRQLTGPGYRRPSFGDYCVQHPDPLSNFDPRMMQSSAQLRYTIQTSWFVARGRGVRTTGMNQVRGLARQVVAHPNFSGRIFSPGDAWIDDCASGACSAGNQMVWRRATTNHHLTYVVRQLATLLGP